MKSVARESIFPLPAWLACLLATLLLPLFAASGKTVVPYSAVREGDMILTRAASSRSRLVASLDRTGDFAHAGVIAFVKGRPYVVTALPVNLHGDIHDIGRVACITLEDYLRRDEYLKIALFRVSAASEAQRAKAARRCLLWFIEKVPFDDSFNLHDPSRLYCTEMVWRAYREAGFTLLRPEALKNRDRINQPIIYPSDLVESPAVRFIGELKALPFR